MRDGGSVSRRGLLGAAGAGLMSAGVMAVATTGNPAGGTTSGDPGSGAGSGGSDGAKAPVDFFGAHQAGITTPAQDRLHFAAFDVITDDRSELIDLMNAWTVAAAQMCAGEPIGTFGAVDGPAVAPPEDTGEALDLSPSNLTVTFGFGPTLFTRPDGTDPLGLKSRRPSALIDLPHFPGDALRPEVSGGDLCIQACANDPQVAVHAIRNLARIGFGVVSVRWSQLGFGRTSSTSTAQATPRNLFGFKDGTANLKAEEQAALERFVWVQPGDGNGAGDDAMVGGSYLVARRINMHIEPWDRTSLVDQELLVGRQKGSGAPLSGGGEFTPVDFSIKGRDDQPLVPTDSHVHVAHPDNNEGVRLLRRGYNFTDGSDGLGRLDAGLFFIAFVRDPATHYVPMQTRMAKQDRMSFEYLQHTGSGLFAVPPGVAKPGAGYVGESLLS